MVDVKNIKIHVDYENGYQDINLEDGRKIREYFEWDVPGFGNDDVYIDFGEVDIYDSKGNLIEGEYNDEELSLIETYCGNKDDLSQEIEESEAYKERFPDFVEKRRKEEWEEMRQELHNF